MSDVAGPSVTQPGVSRGMAVGDLDNDGSLEVVINNMDAPPSLLKNYGTKKNWVLVRCVGTTSTRDGIGARVSVYVGKRPVSGEVQSGTSFLSQNDPRLHFGLANEGTYSRIEVQWPGGQREVFPGGKANQIVTLKQGTGVPSKP